MFLKTPFTQSLLPSILHTLLIIIVNPHDVNSNFEVPLFFLSFYVYLRVFVFCLFINILFDHFLLHSICQIQTRIKEMKDQQLKNMFRFKVKENGFREKRFWLTSVPNQSFNLELYTLQKMKLYPASCQEQVQSHEESENNVQQLSISDGLDSRQGTVVTASTTINKSFNKSNIRVMICMKSRTWVKNVFKGLETRLVSCCFQDVLILEKDHHFIQ